MSAPSVRIATVDDVTDIFKIAKSRPFTAKWSAEALSAEIPRADSIFLVVPGHGYALARVVADDCRLLDLAAASDGAGVGRALISALSKTAKARSCAKITLEVSALNSRAISFYEKAGWRVVGRRPKFYDDGSDAVLMDLDIS